jgi:hypothetical protein
MRLLTGRFWSSKIRLCLLGMVFCVGCDLQAAAAQQLEQTLVSIVTGLAGQAIYDTLGVTSTSSAF